MTLGESRLDGRGGWIPTQPCSNLLRHHQTAEQKVKGSEIFPLLLLGILDNCTHFKGYFLKKTKSIFVCVTAKSDPGVTGPLHLLPLPIINASKFKDGFNHCYRK